MSLFFFQSASPVLRLIRLIYEFRFESSHIDFAIESAVDILYLLIIHFRWADVNFDVFIARKFYGSSSKMTECELSRLSL